MQVVVAVVERLDQTIQYQAQVEQGAVEQVLH
jgi:hypothetical protein